ncbi:MAG: flagellar biosynthesis protein FlgL [Microgenomates group bacterium]
MSLVSLGDMAQSFLLRRQSMAAKLDISRLSTELTTGRTADLGRHLSGDLVPFSALDTSLARLKGFSTVTKDAGVYLGAMQATLGSFTQMGGDLSRVLMSAASGQTALGVDAAGLKAEQSFQTAVSMLNTQVGGQTLFAGDRTQGTAIASADAILQQIEAAITLSGAVSAQDVELAVANWFAAPAGFGLTGYLGGPPLAVLQIAPGESVTRDITAADPALVKNLQALATAALLGRGLFVGQPAARQDLARRTGVALLEGQSDLTYLSARLGNNEAQVDEAATRNAAEGASLEMARNALVAVDPYETASKLQESQAQLEKIFLITARMSKLSLTEYM